MAKRITNKRRIVPEDIIYRASQEFVRYVDENKLLGSNPSERIDKIGYALKILGYSVLFAKGGKVIQIEECSDGRLIEALRTSYKMALSRIKRYEDRIRSGWHYKNLADMIRNEKELLDDDKREEISERIAIIMDSTPRNVLIVLGKDFGEMALGGYYIHD
ncbi:MAG: hypothetical protein QW727_01080 [Candidatus Pacearchaeota archaeon]